MSRYIKLEDAEKAAGGASMFDGRVFVEDVLARLADLPTIEVSEDAISREYVKGICEDMLDEEMLGHMLGYIEQAPSVLPQPKEGEWIIEEKDSIYGKKIRLICSECGDVFDVTEAALPYERYCRYCGARMKGADDE